MGEGERKAEKGEQVLTEENQYFSMSQEIEKINKSYFKDCYLVACVCVCVL